jgi:hypothetical protein
VSQDQNPNKTARPTGTRQPSEITTSDGGAEIDENSDSTVSQVDMIAQNEQNAESDQTGFDLNFLTLIQLLENMGFCDAGGGSDLQNSSDVNPADGNPLPAIKALLAQIQQNDALSTADLKTGFERLQQIMTHALEGKGLVSMDGNSGQGFSPIQGPDPAQISQWLKGLIPGIEDQKGIDGLLTGEGPSRATPPGVTATGARAGIETIVGSLDMSSSINGTGSMPAAESSAALSPPENRNEADPEATTGNRPPISKNHQDPKAAIAVESTDANPAKTKPVSDFLGDERIIDRTQTEKRMPPAPDPDQQGDPESTRGSQQPKPSTSSGTKSAMTIFSDNPIQTATGEEPLSKVFQDAQLVKEGIVKPDPGTTEESTSKVIKTEAGTNDTGQLNPSGQNAEKTAETASVAKETESSQSSLRNQTLDQIVRRAAISLKTGQHEARIDLKPDFLGHIRMHVISDNQQVTVKILAQHGFVKDMIENNVHQLKADLQQQGLEFDKLEVSVSHDSEGSGNFRQKFAQSKARQSTGNHPQEDQSAEEHGKDTRRPPRRTERVTTVDYFA